MQIRVVGTANLQQAQSQFAALTAQVAALNVEMARSAATPIAPAQSMAQMKALHGALAANVAAGTQWRAQQVRVNDVIQENIKLLGKQRLGMNEVFGKKNRALMRETYNEHLRLQRATLFETKDAGGQMVRTLLVPNEVHKSWDTLSQRAAFYGNQLRSVGVQTQNWGKNMQWAGRQITVGLGYPLALLGAAAGVMAYKTDELLTDITKVYDTTANSMSDRASDMAAVEKELNNVRSESWKTAKKLADEYGMAVTDTLGVTKELAATGFRGEELQKATETIARISRLGDVDPQAAEEAYRALKNVLGETAEEAEKSFNYINAIENATSLNTSDFVTSIPIALNAVKNMNGGLEDMGTLLVAMKSRGIDANEGANAIKSLMGRLYRPSKQVREEWKGLINIDPKSFIEKGGSIIDILKRIGEATEGLAPEKRTQLLAGLFGVYQVTRMDAMVKGLMDVNDASTEVGRSMQVANMSAEDLARTAELELGRKMESTSAKFKRAFEVLRSEITEMGEPFLKFGTQVLEALTGIIRFLDGLPSGVKKLGAIVLVMGGLAGVGMMLLGIFGNLFGAVLRGIGFFFRLGAAIKGGTRMTQLFNAEETAARMAVENLNTGIVKQVSQTQALTLSMTELAAALAAVSAAQTKVAAGTTTAAAAAGATAAARGPVNGSAAAYFAAANAKQENVRQNATAYLQRQAAADRAATAEAKKQAEARAKIVAQQKAANAAQRQQNVLAASGAASMALMVGSMIAMTSSSDKNTQNIAQWTMIGALILPMMVSMIGAIKRATVAQLALNAATKGQVGILGRLKGMVGKGGLIGLGVAGIAATFAGLKYFGDREERAAAERAKKIREEQKKIAAEQLKVVGITNKWAEATGNTLQGYKLIMGQVGKLQGKKNDDLFAQTRDFYRKSEKEGGGESQAIAFGNMKDGAVKNAKLFTMATDLLVRGGYKIEEVKTILKGFVVASGETMMEASQNIDQLAKNLDGSMTRVMQRAAQGQLDVFSDLVKNATDKEVIKQNAEETANVWMQAFTNSKNTPAAGTLMENLLKSSDASASVGLRKELDLIFKDIDANIASREKNGMDTTNFENIKTALTEATSSAEKFKAALGDGRIKTYLEQVLDMSINGGATKTGDAIRNLIDNVEDLGSKSNTFDTEMLNVLKSLGYVDKGVASLSDAFKDAKSEMFQFLNIKDQMKILDELSGGIRNVYTQLMMNPTDGGEMTGINALLNRDQIKGLVDQMLLINNLKPGKNLEESLRRYFNILPGVIGKTDDLKISLDKLDGRYQVNVDVNVDDAREITKNAWANLQQAIADDWMSGVESRQQAAMDSLEASHSAAADALDARQQAASDAFDKRWERKTERVEAFYDRRIERVNKTIEAEKKAEALRQEIFEKEKERLSRLTELANARIDVNVALRTGNFDEAAKLQNNLDSTIAGWQMDDQKEAGKKGSDARVEKMEARVDLIEKEKDKALKALKEREAATRRHLQRVQEMRRNALQRQQAMEKASLQRSQQMERENEQRKIDYFLSRIVTSKKELRKWMDDTGIKYTEFGRMLKQKGTNWADFFHKEWTEKIRNAISEIRSDAIWESLGAKAIGKMIKGGTGLTWSQWKGWMNTGKFPEKQDNHGGGLIGAGGTGRAGVARGVQGLHSTERMVRAREGEFMVREAVTKKNLGALEYLNRTGNLPSPPREGRGELNTPDGGGGMVPNVATIMSGIAAQTGNSALKSTYSNALRYDRAAKRKARLGLLGATGLGNLSIPKNLPAGLNERQKMAFAFANRQISGDIGGWYRACLKFVRMAFGDPGGVATASDSYRMSKNRGAIYGGTPPVGVPLFWPDSGAGHVGISGPGGRVLGTDYPRVDKIGYAPSIAEISRWTGDPYAGWSNWINNTKILSLSKGAQNIRWDNTLANLHKGEAVLTEDINRQFKQGVKNFANGPSNETNVNFHVHGNVYGLDDINAMADVAVKKIKQQQARLPGSRNGNK